MLKNVKKLNMQINVEMVVLIVFLLLVIHKDQSRGNQRWLTNVSGTCWTNNAQPW